ncbi:nitrate/nitrite transporter NrtS [Parasphingopyxis sp.]|uniref:nitrate/nitrite transporter NrtS n=1 Tax=Parasphingopyxis sp. TaxID=1920299 RepID=UPI002638176F|nr:nitrate/nitrite transporter NrtS [Parasphingopyxis sp.]
MADRSVDAIEPFYRLLLHPVTVRRAFKVALVIGTLLVAINQGDVIMAGTMPPIWKILLTYLVPYGVSSYSTAALLRDTQRAGK